MLKTILVPDQTYLDSLKTYVGFTDESSAVLREAYDVVAPHFASIIDDFYATIAAHPGARAAITGGTEQIERLKQTLRQWLAEVFTGPHDEAYFVRRARIGRVHVRISLPQAYMFTAMDRIRVKALDALTPALAAQPEHLRRVAIALHQILDIELAIMLETYREDLEAKNRTAERLSTIGQFAASIGHELRNPLGVVESSVFLMRKRMELAANDDPILTRHLEKIATEVQRSNKTINDLLELARNKPPKKRRTTAADVITHALAAISIPAGVDVQVDAPGDVYIDGDVDQLGRVLTNLVMNAAQAMGGKGHIVMQARRQNDHGVIQVTDDGPGVAPDVRSRIFEALFTTKAKGSGLGLALCRRIAEAHGGTVVLEPSARGASFLLSIPDDGASERPA